MTSPFPKGLAVRAPASTSNLGAGFDCVGLALDVWLEAKLEAGEGDTRYAGQLEGMSPEDDLIAQTLVEAGWPEGMRLTVRSDIPVGRGLGASAAATVAALALASMIRGETPNREAIYATALEREGHPDNAGPAVYGGCTLAATSGDRPRSRPVPVPVDFEVGVALAVPDTEIRTNDARDLLPDQVPRTIVIGQAARAAALVLGLGAGDADLIRTGMEDLLAVPARKSLISGFDDAVAAARSAGAYGATISGSGSTVLALGPRAARDRIAAAMCEALTPHHESVTPLVPDVSSRGFEVE